MPEQGSAVKRHRQSEKRRLRNRAEKSEVRSAVKKFTQAVESKNVSEAEQSFRSMVKLLDTAGRKGILHKNMVARKKSRMQKLLNSISV